MRRRFFTDILLGYRIITLEDDYLCEAIRILFKLGIPFYVKKEMLFLPRAVYKDAASKLDGSMIKKSSSYLGIRGLAVSYGKNSNGKDLMGIYVSSIESNSPAYYAGLQPGDIIISVGKKKTTTMNQFMEALYGQKEGETTEIKVKRKGREQYKEIVFQVALGVE